MSTGKTAPFNPIILVVIGVVSVSFAAIFVRLSTAPAAIIAFYRLLIATLFTAGLVMVNEKGAFPWPSWQDLKFTFASGLFLALHFWTWFQSLKLTSVASSTVLVATQPLFVIIAARFLLAERLSVKAQTGVGITIIGSVLTTSLAGIGSSSALGNGLAILAAAFAAIYFFIGHQARQQMSLDTYTFWSYLTCTIILGLIGLAQGYSFGPYPAVDWWAFLGLGIICHIGGHTSLNWSLGYLSPSVVSTAILGEPVGASLWAWLFFQEAPAWTEISGGLLIIFGLITFMGEAKLGGDQGTASSNVESLSDLKDWD